MKKILFIILVMFSTTSWAQRFNITPNGLVDSTDSTKNYLVIKVPGKTSRELFKSVIKYVIKYRSRPNESITIMLDSSYIRFETYIPYVPTTALSLAGLRYTTDITTKDGKLKYKLSPCDVVWDPGKKEEPLTVFFTKKGTIVFGNAGIVKGIQELINAETLLFSEFMKGNIPEEDW